ARSNRLGKKHILLNTVALSEAFAKCKPRLYPIGSIILVTCAGNGKTANLGGYRKTLAQVNFTTSGD
ncbi:MAG: hypothetical protein ACOVN5_15105, partial [Aquidulcibacter sp.]